MLLKLQTEHKRGLFFKLYITNFRDVRFLKDILQLKTIFQCHITITWKLIFQDETIMI